MFPLYGLRRVLTPHSAIEDYFASPDVQDYMCSSGIRRGVIYAWGSNYLRIHPIWAAHITEVADAAAPNYAIQTSNNRMGGNVPTLLTLHARQACLQLVAAAHRLV